MDPAQGQSLPISVLAPACPKEVTVCGHSFGLLPFLYKHIRNIFSSWSVFSHGGQEVDSTLTRPEAARGVSGPRSPRNTHCDSDLSAKGSLEKDPRRCRESSGKEATQEHDQASGPCGRRGLIPPCRSLSRGPADSLTGQLPVLGTVD